MKEKTVEWTKGKSLRLAWWSIQLKELMDIKKLTEEDLAKATGMKQSNVHKLIEGKYNPSFKTMQNLVKELEYIIKIDLPF